MNNGLDTGLHSPAVHHTDQDSIQSPPAHAPATQRRMSQTSQIPLELSNLPRLNRNFSGTFQSVANAREFANSRAAIIPQGRDQPVLLGNVVGDDIPTGTRPVSITNVAEHGKEAVWHMPSGDRNASQAGVTKPANGTYNFAYHSNGDIKIGKTGHYFLAQGDPGAGPAFAGEVVFKEGVVQAWNNNSGHFSPPPGLVHQGPFPADRFGAQHVSIMARAGQPGTGGAWSIQKQAEAHQAAVDKKPVATTVYAQQKEVAHARAQAAQAETKNSEDGVQDHVKTIYENRKAPDWSGKPIATIVNDLATEHDIGKGKVKAALKPYVKKNFSDWKD